MIIIPIPVEATTDWPEWAIWTVGTLWVIACLVAIYLTFKMNVMDE